ncbi:MAG: hypothetical protein COB50_00480 [Thiotrichales bacterium]|nr:MAG: hypothetical protein COB50_00480 [Thiotrichales bacterium]
MKIKKILAIAAAAALIGGYSTVAFADEEVSAQQGGAQNGFYVGAKGGYSWIDSYKITDTKRKTGNFAWGVEGGYDYAFNRTFSLGLEVSYFDYGRTKYTGNTEGKFKSRSINLMLTGKAYVQDNFNVFVKGGLARVKQKYSGKITGNTKNKTKPIVEVGAGYQFNNNIGVDVSYVHVFGKDKTNPASVNAIFAGVSYKIMV